MKKLIQCPNGHYYNSEQYASCPYCQSESVPGNFGNRETECFYPEQKNPGYDPNAVDINVSGGYIPSNGQRQTVSFKELQNNPVFPQRENKADQADDENKTMAYFAYNKLEKEETKSGSQYADNPVVGWLVCIEGNNYGKSCCMYAGKNFIGRYDDMDICLKGDSSVARSKHAIITYEPKTRKFFAQPGESHQLFYVNGNVVLTSVELQNRDEIAIGQTVLVFVPFCDEKYGWE